MAALSVQDDVPVVVKSNNSGVYSIDHIKAKSLKGYSPDQ
jgi:hypothetical protein